MSPLRGLRAMAGEGDGGGRQRAVRLAVIAGGAVLVAGAAYFGLSFLEEPEAPPPPTRPVRRAAAAPKPDSTAKSPAVPGQAAAGPAGAKPAKGSATATAAPVKPQDAARQVAVPAKPAPGAAKTAVRTPGAATNAGKPAAAGTPVAAAATAAAGKQAAAAAPGKPGTPATTGPGSPAAPTTAIAEVSQVTIQREVFAYDGGRRRDPFVSLARPTDVGPLLGELRLIGVAYDEPSNRNTVAILRDGQKGMYRVKVGQSVGRARVSAIGRRSVTFAIEEFGVTRQEVLSIRDTTRRGN